VGTLRNAEQPLGCQAMDPGQRAAFVYWLIERAAKNLKIKAYTTVKSDRLWDVTPCRPVEVHQRFTGTYCLLFDPEDGGSAFIRNVG
jgi:hypothetical protein